MGTWREALWPSPVMPTLSLALWGGLLIMQEDNLIYVSRRHWGKLGFLGATSRKGGRSAWQYHAGAWGVWMAGDWMCARQACRRRSAPFSVTALPLQVHRPLPRVTHWVREVTEGDIRKRGKLKAGTEIKMWTSPNFQTWETGTKYSSSESTCLTHCMSIPVS